MERPFCLYQNFDPMALTFNCDKLLKKNLTLAITFELKEMGLSY